MLDVTRAMRTSTVETRHGVFTIFDEDELVGLSLATYGEYSEGEVEVFRKILKPGDVAIDVGANIGALTMPMHGWSARVARSTPSKRVVPTSICCSRTCSRTISNVINFPWPPATRTACSKSTSSSAARLFPSRHQRRRV